MLAMEGHETDSDQKAQDLIKVHTKEFKYMGYTRHKLREHESKGKASNVSWCCEHLLQHIADLKIS